MRFADSLHKRIHRISRFNTRFLKDEENKSYEASSIKTPMFIYYSLDFGDKFGYVVENRNSGFSILKRMSKEEPQELEENVSDATKHSLWYISLLEIEESLKDSLKEVDEYESKLLTIAANISKRTT